MISVSEALDRLFALVAPVDAEQVPLISASGRILRAPIVARRNQPPFAASAMDGYACRSVDLKVGTTLRVIGEAPAGHAFSGQVDEGEAVRIFTGAPMPIGADTVLIQEDTERNEGGVQVMKRPAPGENVRPAGGDFLAGTQIEPPRRLRPSEIALAASMNVPLVSVARRPIVAILATGNELVMPGEDPGPDQIVASNCFGLSAMFETEGAETRLLPIARDTVPSLRGALMLARGADLIVTIGGASVGDHDLVAEAAATLGMDRAFYKVAMRPGKPLMAGRLHGVPMIGLPGNPVSAMICGHIFIIPVLRAMLGLGARPAPRVTRPLATALAPNGPREHYMRARHAATGLTPFERQDSSLLTVLAEADALIVRPVADPARQAGDMIEAILL